MKVLSLSVMALVCCTSFCSGGEPKEEGRFYTKGLVGFIPRMAAAFDKINAYLAGFSERSPKECLKNAMDWYDELIKSEKPDTDTLDGLRLFQSLSITDNNRCSVESYEILKKNVDAIKWRNYKQSLSPSDNVGFTVSQYVHKHAKVCHSVYLHKFRAKNLHDEIMMKIEIIFDNIKTEYIKKQAYYKSGDEVESLFGAKKDVNVSWPFCQGTFLWKLLDSFDDPQVKAFSRKSLKLEEDKAAELELIIKKHLSDPCRYYIDQVDRDIFLPAKFYAMFEDQLDANALDYYKGWIQADLCRDILRTQRFFIRYLESSRGLHIGKLPF